MNQDAAKGARIAAAVEAMYSPGVLIPAFPAALAAEYSLIDYITARNALFGTQRIGLGDRVFYGFLAQSRADATRFIVAIRGTECFAEWAEDAEAFLLNHVHVGFLSIGETMECGIPTESLAAAISARVPLGSHVDFYGHSLGAPLAAFALLAARQMNISARGYFYAMPKMGDAVFAKMFDDIVGADNYMVWNYLRDVVPQLPLWLPLQPFVRLNNRIVIRPKDSSAVIPNDVANNHHAANYAALLEGMQ